jgi:hypothetical protein
MLLREGLNGKLLWDYNMIKGHVLIFTAVGNRKALAWSFTFRL